MPMADKLLETIKMKREQMQGGQPGENVQIPPELMSQVNAGVNPQANQLINQMFQR